MDSGGLNGVAKPEFLGHMPVGSSSAPAVGRPAPGLITPKGEYFPVQRRPRS
jgi:hypothetical protein